MYKNELIEFILDNYTLDEDSYAQNLEICQGFCKLANYKLHSPWTLKPLDIYRQQE